MTRTHYATGEARMDVSVVVVSKNDVVLLFFFAQTALLIVGELSTKSTF